MDINELTYQINGAIFEVNRELGAGFLEDQAAGRPASEKTVIACAADIPA